MALYDTLCWGGDQDELCVMQCLLKPMDYRQWITELDPEPCHMTLIVEYKNVMRVWVNIFASSTVQSEYW